jgi:aminomethyltransferase
MVPFGGFEMPVQYEGIKAEHAAVRERAGLFDVSHMGQIHLEGPEAVASAERLVTCPVASLRPGRVRYGVLCNESGGSVDDVTLYRLAEDRLFLCVNASNIDKDRAWIENHALPGAKLDDRSEATGLIALQGPRSPGLLASLAEGDVAGLKFFRFIETRVAGWPALVSRSGYTGSDGYEIYVDTDHATALFEALLVAGRDAGIAPVGLGARDTLRLEAALPLYGHELDDATSPLEAGLQRFVKLDAGGFLGAEALAQQAADGVAKQLVGFELSERGVARADHPLLDASGARVGRVTSGAPSPTLGTCIGLGYVPGAELGVEIRGRRVRARIVATPFYRRPRS